MSESGFLLSASLAAMMLTLSVFIGASLVQFDRHQQTARYILALFFWTLSLSHLINLVGIVFPDELGEGALLIVRLSGLFTFYLLGPLIYLYTRILTQGVHRGWQTEIVRGSRGAMVAFVLTLPLMLRAHEGVVIAIFGSVEVPVIFDFVAAIGTLVAVVGIIPFSYYYLYLSWRLLVLHLQGVMAFFSNIQNRKLSWLRWLIVLLAIQMTLATFEILDAVFFKTSILPIESGDALELASLFSIGLLALRYAVVQTTTGGVESPENLATQTQREATRQPYERSGLTAEQAKRIAQRLEKAMRTDELYHNPFLNLSNLAAHTGVNPHRISQVLNTHMKMSFFDFVNGWRVKEAEQRLKNEAENILQISEEVGFNSRSTFNAAFKKSTGLSPSAYRQSLQQSDSTGTGTSPG